MENPFIFKMNEKFQSCQEQFFSGLFCILLYQLSRVSPAKKCGHFFLKMF